MKRNPQAPSTVVMVRPHKFRTNPETASDNVFQKTPHAGSEQELEAQAFDEVTIVVEKLEDAGVEVLLFEDDDELTPDSVFPNNWFSTHDSGHIVLYPMCHPTRRCERRSDVIEFLTKRFPTSDIVDYSNNEADGVYLEGTGAIVLDHLGRIAYAAQSQRAHPDVFQRWCDELGYKGVLFNACDENGVPIYHTNVLMCVATRFALIGLDLILSQSERQMVEESLSSAIRSPNSPAMRSNFRGRRAAFSPFQKPRFIPFGPINSRSLNKAPISSR